MGAGIAVGLIVVGVCAATVIKGRAKIKVIIPTSNINNRNLKKKEKGSLCYPVELVSVIVLEFVSVVVVSFACGAVSFIGGKVVVVSLLTVVVVSFIGGVVVVSLLTGGVVVVSFETGVVVVVSLLTGGVV